MDSLAIDINALANIGIRVIIVHGGGKKISHLLKKIGKDFKFIDGLRVTDKETMDATQMVLAGLVNKEIVSCINAHGIKSVGISGMDGGLLKGKKNPTRQSSRLWICGRNYLY